MPPNLVADSRPGYAHLVMLYGATESYEKEIFTGAPGHDLRHRENVNKQVGAPIFLTF